MSEKQSFFTEFQYGSYLLVPLKYDGSLLDPAAFSTIGVRCEIESDDISESVKQTINTQGTSHSVLRYRIANRTLMESVTGPLPLPELPPLYALSSADAEPTPQCRFSLADSELYLFGSNVAFLCIGLTYPNMTVLRRICNLGYTKSETTYCFSSADGLHIFDLNESIRGLFAGFGLEPFSKPGTPLFVDSHIFNIGVVRERFESLDNLRKAAFNLHLLEELTRVAEDESEEDIHFTYSVKNQELGSHRFGYCITSQTISYMVANDALDIHAEMEDQRINTLPLILLALYQKYTCLRFRELLSSLPGNDPHALLNLKLDMMEFQAYGAFPPSDMSRWHNIKQTYKYVLIANEIPEAVADLSLSLKILAEREKKFEERAEKLRDRKSNLVLYLISLFGIISIPESVLSLVMYFVEGQWLRGILSCSLLLILLTLILFILIFWKKKH
ncbi:MAG: hypothetical protein IKZ21_02095 [Clostridia bacterium]|nr:hypothetical protein [Clostridia bacterium]